jgi:hypothetical protein
MKLPARRPSGPLPRIGAPSSEELLLALLMALLVALRVALLVAILVALADEFLTCT